MVVCKQAEKAAGGIKAAADVTQKWQQTVHDVHNWSSRDNISSLWTSSRLCSMQLSYETVLQLPRTHPGKSPHGYT